MPLSGYTDLENRRVVEGARGLVVNMRYTRGVPTHADHQDHPTLISIVALRPIKSIRDHRAAPPLRLHSDYFIFLVRSAIWRSS